MRSATTPRTATAIPESTHTATLVVPGAGSLGFANTSVPSQPIYNSGGALSVRPGNLPISFQAAADPTVINAQVDIFQGVLGWATVAGVPSSPTASTTASLVVGGQNVDYYIYRLNGGTWSAESPASAPLHLSGLTAGSNSVSVLGRSQYGTYLDASNAVSVGWVVDPNAPATTISGAPATPSRTNAAQLTIGGAGVTDYRWTLNNGYYRATAAVANPLVLSNLTAGQQVLAVLGGTNGVDQATNVPTTVAWTVNPIYGYDQSALPPVRSLAFTNIGGGAINVSWNGQNDAGVLQPQGWYTVRLTLTDPLGNTNFAVALVQIGSLSGTNLVLAGANRGPQNPFARGRWAVWQDQSDGNWEIYAQDVTASNSPLVKVTSTPLSQEHPQTDGRYVVWQAQQTNGNWDVYVSDLSGGSGTRAVTSTPSLDEINPAIDWPWVVYQARPAGNSGAPWQLYAFNLATSQSFQVSPSTQDELDPAVQAGRVVWQDWRDVGPGEIYLYDLEKGLPQRITTNSFGQYHPAIYGNWIVWQDNRNTELDIYGFDLLRNREFRITNTPEDELQPYLNGPWLVCAENSLGPLTGNARLIHLPSLLAVPVTRTPTMKAFPALADGYAVWQETVSNQTSIVAASLPNLQAVFQNRNAIAVTDAMVAYAHNAYGLLAAWASNGVQQITAYTSLTPQVRARRPSSTTALRPEPILPSCPAAFCGSNSTSSRSWTWGSTTASPSTWRRGQMSSATAVSRTPTAPSNCCAKLG